MRKIEICTVYPSDPLGPIPGGIESFIRGLVQHAPADIHYRIVGVTTDEELRPVGRTTTCKIGDKSFDFFPVAALSEPGRQPKIPVTLTFSARLPSKHQAVRGHIFELHRLEPLAALPRLRKQSTVLFLHQNMTAIEGPGADIRWRYAPRLYFALERWLLRTVNQIYTVRKDVVDYISGRFPELESRPEFVPTWADPHVFRRHSTDLEQQNRREVAAELGVAPDADLLIFVGRLDAQKDPLLLLRAFAKLRSQHPDAALLLVGDGVLRQQCEEFCYRERLGPSVRFLGLQPREEVARLLRAASLFVLSSAYEGMPMSVIEALACGTPVVATDVGEVGTVLQSGDCGELVEERDADALAGAMSRCLSQQDAETAVACVAAAQPYVPETVLQPVWERYRQLAAG